MDYVLPVHEGHPAHAARYCELCGAEVDRQGDCLRDCTDDADIVAAIGMIARWALHKPLHMRVLAARIEWPTDSIRDTAQKVGIGKSRVCDILRELEAGIPGAGRMLGGQTKAAIGQRRRRTTG